MPPVGSRCSSPFPTSIGPAGGTAGLPNGEPLRGPVAAINVAAIGPSGLAALLALALVRPWGASVPRWLLLAGAWAACALLGLRGAGGLAQGILEDGAWSDEGSDALVVGFEVLFLLGGILFGLAATEYARSTRVVVVGRANRERADGECLRRPP